MKKRYLLLMVTTALWTGNSFAGTAGDAGVADACGTGCSYTISDDGKTLTVTGTGNNASIATNAFQSDSRFSSIKNLVITGTISSVGDRAFFACSNITSLDIQSPLVTINDGAFHDAHITSVTIPGSVTKIAGDAFGRSTLESVIIPASVIEIGTYTFHDNYNLSSVVIEGTPTIGDNAFNGIASNAVVYCLEDYTGCENKGANVSYYRKQKGNYILSDGTVIGTYPYKEPKRIYTIEEAHAIVKAIGKDHVTFRIRYK